MTEQLNNNNSKEDYESILRKVVTKEGKSRLSLKSIHKEDWNLKMHKQLGQQCSSACCCCSIAQSCPTLCHRMDYSTRGFPVLHYLLEFAQTCVHWLNDDIHPSHPLSPPSLLALNLSQHQALFQWAGSLHQVAKVLELQPWIQAQPFVLDHHAIVLGSGGRGYKKLHWNLKATKASQVYLIGTSLTFKEDLGSAFRLPWLRW